MTFKVPLFLMQTAKSAEHWLPLDLLLIADFHSSLGFNNMPGQFNPGFFGGNQGGAGGGNFGNTQGGGDWSNPHGVKRARGE